MSDRIGGVSVSDVSTVTGEGVTSTIITIAGPFLGMSAFTSKWEKQGSGFGEKLKDSLKPAGPLKPRLEQATRQIQIQIARLDGAASKLKERDNSIFTRVVTSVQKHDQQHAAVFANELAEIRKMYKMITHAKLALEQVVMRLNTVKDLGDVVVSLAPAMSIIRNIKPGLASVLPGAEQEIGDINGLLSSILIDAGQIGGYTLNFDAANEDAERIMDEASTVAEQRMKSSLPDIPTGVGEASSETQGLP